MDMETGKATRFGTLNVYILPPKRSIIDFQYIYIYIYFIFVKLILCIPIFAEPKLNNNYYYSLIFEKRKKKMKFSTRKIFKCMNVTLLLRPIFLGLDGRAFVRLRSESSVNRWWEGVRKHSDPEIFHSDFEAIKNGAGWRSNVELVLTYVLEGPLTHAYEMQWRRLCTHLTTSQCKMTISINKIKLWDDNSFWFINLPFS